MDVFQQSFQVCWFSRSHSTNRVPACTRLAGTSVVVLMEYSLTLPHQNRLTQRGLALTEDGTHYAHIRFSSERLNQPLILLEQVTDIDIK